MNGGGLRRRERYHLRALRPHIPLLRRVDRAGEDIERAVRGIGDRVEPGSAGDRAGAELGGVYVEGRRAELGRRRLDIRRDEKARVGDVGAIADEQLDIVAASELLA